jgi:dihydroorotate dehydrogenase electron transfer subunit
VEIFFLKSGAGTTLLSQKQEGETLDILGPLGKGFCLKRDSRNTAMALIGGGRGIAPLYFLAQRLQGLGADSRIYYGGRTRADLPLLEKFQQENFDALFSTDDGSFGFKGLVTNLFARELKHNSFARIYGCGPEAMMRKTAQIAQDNSISAEFSLESLMGCGFGACWGCVRRIKTENREEWVKICEEGPVFSGNQIIWEDEAS